MLAGLLVLLGCWCCSVVGAARLLLLFGCWCCSVVGAALLVLLLLLFKLVRLGCHGRRLLSDTAGLRWTGMLLLFKLVGLGCHGLRLLPFTDVGGCCCSSWSDSDVGCCWSDTAGLGWVA